MSYESHILIPKPSLVPRFGIFFVSLSFSLFLFYMWNAFFFVSALLLLLCGSSFFCIPSSRVLLLLPIFLFFPLWTLGFGRRFRCRLSKLRCPSILELFGCGFAGLSPWASLSYYLLCNGLKGRFAIKLRRTFGRMFERQESSFPLSIDGETKGGEGIVC